jgi:N-acetylneuraminate synthase
MARCRIIAEAGVNHNGNEDMAFELIDVAQRAGADVVKFQTFRASSLVTTHAPQAEYQQKNTQKTESQLAMLSRLELSYETHYRLLQYCRQRDIEFLSTAFDFSSLDFLVKGLKLKTLKIPSGEIINAPFLLEHARSGCDLIISTGMTTLAEVEDALAVIAFGLVGSEDHAPGLEAFHAAYASSAGQQALAEKVTLMHCTTEYPAPLDEINLRNLDTLANAFGLRVGYSDHSAGISVPVAAAARGAVLLEKHFTLDRNLDGPDHRASLEPDELRDMIRAVREVELALGRAIKAPSPAELKNRDVARKSITAARYIAEGELFTVENLTVMRPGSGLSPMRFWELLGKPAGQDYETGEMING